MPKFNSGHKGILQKTRHFQKKKQKLSEIIYTRECPLALITIVQDHQRTVTKIGIAQDLKTWWVQLQSLNKKSAIKTIMGCLGVAVDFQYPKRGNRTMHELWGTPKSTQNSWKQGVCRASKRCQGTLAGREDHWEALIHCRELRITQKC